MFSFLKNYYLRAPNGKVQPRYYHVCCSHPLICASNRRQSEGVFVWVTEWKTELFFDLQEVVRFRVEAERWNDVAPRQPKAEEVDDNAPKTPPYQIIVSSLHSSV